MGTTLKRTGASSSKDTLKTEEYIHRIKSIKSRLQQDDLDQLEAEIEQLTEARPERVGGYLLKVEIALRNSDIEKAIAVLEKGSLKCADERIKIQLTILYSKERRFEESIDLGKELVERNPDNLTLCLAYAKSLGAIKKITESIRILKKCLTIDSNHIGVLNELAHIYFKIEDFEKAKSLYQQILEISPSKGISWVNIGNIQVKNAEYRDAITSYQKSLELDPTLSEAYYNLGQVYSNILGDKVKSLEWYQRGYRLGKGNSSTVLEILAIVTKWQLADWSSYISENERLGNLLLDYLNQEIIHNLVPYELSFAGIHPQVYMKVAAKYSNAIKESLTVSKHNRSYDHSIGEGKVRVGYYSPNFRLHPGGFLVRTLFEHHDRSKFEIHAFSLVSSEDYVKNDIEEATDYFHDVSKMTSVEIADFINREKIDVLVALAGYNTQMKLDVLALKPAPIQIMTLGSHETTGSNFIDYVFSDSVASKEQLKDFYSESIITLPCSIMFNCPLPEVNANSTNRADHNLPENKFVFASFNHPRKLDPATIDTWVKILQASKDSVLWIYHGGIPKIAQNLKEYFKKKGVFDKVVFADKVEINQHWERIKHADVLLDCFTYNAHFTAIEFLRYGVPMITLKGDSHNSRLGSSILHFAGLSDLIANSVAEYIALALDRHKVYSFKEKLAEKNQLLFDSWMQVKYLESAYKKALDMFRRNKVKSFKVKPLLPFDSK